MTPTGYCPSSSFKVSQQGHQAFEFLYGKSSWLSVLRVCSRSVSKVISPSRLFKVSQQGYQSFGFVQCRSARSLVLRDCSRSVSMVSNPSRLFKVSQQGHQSFEIVQGQSARSSLSSGPAGSCPLALFKVSHQRHWYL